MTPVGPRWQRVLLKIGGEALSGENQTGLSASRLDWFSEEVIEVLELGVSMGVMVGGGNIWRGARASEAGIDRATGDYMGMLATIINALALQDALEKRGIVTRVQSAVSMREIAEPYIRKRAISHLSKKRIVLFGAGTGNPFFTSDTAAALRAMEIDAEVLLKATKTDGVYDADPELEPSAMPFPELTYHEVLKKNLKVMDLTAVSLAMGRELPIIVFNLREKGNILKVICGEKVGTLITGENL